MLSSVRPTSCVPLGLVLHLLRALRTPQAVLEQERGSNGKVAVQCATLLKHLLAKLQASTPSSSLDAPAPLSSAGLLRLLKLCHPMSAAEISAAAAGGAPAAGPSSKKVAAGEGNNHTAAAAAAAVGVEVMSKNNEAVELLSKVLEAVVDASAVGLKKDSCAFSNLPVFLPLVVNVSEYSALARAHATNICIRILVSDPTAFKVCICLCVRVRDNVACVRVCVCDWMK
jgi:hypothetical protein